MQQGQLPLILQRAVVSLRACSAKAASQYLPAIRRPTARPGAQSPASTSMAGSVACSMAPASAVSDSESAPSWQGQHVLDTLKAPSRLASGLYIVATPIGNLEDITLRALRVLRDAECILAEDTRHTRKLLTYFGLSSRLYSFHEHNEHEKESQVLERVKGGAAVALVSDAGVPAVSDPGAKLVAGAVAQGVTVVPVPGPSAVLAALVASGIACDTFQFVGFLHAKQGQRQKQLKQLAGTQATLIFFSPPHGLASVLADMASALGEGRRCVIAPELTKVHEQFHRGRLGDLAAEVKAAPLKGEVTVVVEGAVSSEGAAAIDDTALKEHLMELIRAGVQPSQAARLVSKLLNLPKGQVYDIAVRIAAQEL